MTRDELLAEIERIAVDAGWTILGAPSGGSLWLVLLRSTPAQVLWLDVRGERSGAAARAARHNPDLEKVNDRVRLLWPVGGGPPPFSFSVARPGDLPTLRSVLA